MWKDKIKQRPGMALGLAFIAGLVLAGLFFYARTEPVAERAEHVHAAEEGTLWTCSMHPQIRQPEPGLCPLCGMELIPLREEVVSVSPTEVRLSPTAAALAQVQTIQVGNGTAEANGSGLRLSGQLRIDESRLYNQVAHVPGRIESLQVNTTGETVRKGQVLASVYSPEIISAQQELIQASKLTGSYEGLLEAAREKLRRYRISEALIHRVEKEGRTFDRVQITADVSGVVTERAVALGDYVEPGQTLYQIADLSQLWVELEAYENQLSSISEGDLLQIRVPQQGKTYEARVSFIDPLVNPDSRTIRVRAEIKNPAGALRPQMLVTATLDRQAAPSRAAQGNFILPRSAVLWTGTRSVVYVKSREDKGPVYEMREVTIQPGGGDAYVIREGLEAGEEVVVNGTFLVDATAQLNNKTSMMNRSVAQPVAQENSSAQAELPRLKGSAALSQHLQSMLEKYLTLKNQLVEGQVAEAKASAAALLNLIEKIPHTGMEAEGHTFVQQQQSKLKPVLEQLQQQQELEDMREQFIPVSAAMIALTKAFDANKAPIFVQFCPMANNDKGAYWLSREKEIRNPYYGDAMLTCGEVTETL